MAMRKLRWITVLGMVVGMSAPLHAEDLHGSIAFSQESDGGHVWGIAWSFESSVSAAAEAINQCRASGGTRCAEAGWFREACGALAIGDGNGYGTGWGATAAAAEQDALAQCRAVNDNCRVEVARCSQSEAAVGSADAQEDSSVAEAAVGQPCEAARWRKNDDGIRELSLAVAWTGECVDGKATGHGTAVWCEPAGPHVEIYGEHIRQAYEGTMHAGLPEGLGIWTFGAGAAYGSLGNP